ncbi:hypothetical protein PENTCL1PPCAC_18845, partial [Pristionchus entomophagus]
GLRASLLTLPSWSSASPLSPSPPTPQTEMVSIRSATRLASTMGKMRSPQGPSRLRPLIDFSSSSSSSTSLSMTSIRVSTTSVVNQYDKIHTEEQAREVVDRLSCEERQLLHAALQLSLHGEGGTLEGEERGEISPEQAKALFLVNGLPFIAFGCLDNMIMIVAGEYIDQSLGAWLALSTMAAAALGNLISDVAGVGLAHYVEIAVGWAGIKHPVLTAKQLESGKSRFMTNSGRAIGLSLGCLIGMFPLLFYNEDKKEKKGIPDAK